MSAETPQRSHSQTRTTEGPAAVVLPQQVTDPTILDSVAGFISDVVPAAYNVPCDSKDQIQWAHFQQLEVDESSFSFDFDCDKFSSPPLLLVLGYTTGVQVWAIPANGEAVELLSWRHGTVRILKFLPAPYKIGCSYATDSYAMHRPLIALCDTATPGPQFCALSFISLKTGDQVKLFKFKNPVLDVLANKRSVVVAFTEKIAVFDAFTLEDRTTVTTCYLSPGINANPVALGTRWMAYAENKLLPNKKSGGGNEGEGVQSYTATVIHAAKSLGRGLRELGETVASSLTGNSPYKPSSMLSNAVPGATQAEIPQKGIVTILNIENQTKDGPEGSTQQPDAIVAHFIAHTEAIVQLLFDPSGLLLLTADKRGHDFHLFKIHPHPLNPALSSAHHLYILHRGDTTARVQDMCFSPDSRWVTVSTLRGTTHVFPITPYGGNVGTRTHATPHVVNRMSRFHRSAGLTAEGRSNSPVSQFEAPVNSNLPYHNPRLPPYPHPTVVNALAQIRQPVYIQNPNNAARQPTGKQRTSSTLEENAQVALRVAASFAPPRAWIDNPSQTRESTHIKPQAKPVESLYVISCHGSLIQYDLDPHSQTVPKEKLCDDTPIELAVSAKAQWVLQRQPHATDVQLPLNSQNLNLIYQEVPIYKPKTEEPDDRWLSQVEIVTHAGPHRRLWMGPQFTFKTYSNTLGTPLNILESQAIDIGKSKPVNMPSSSAYPVLIECGSLSSCEPSPKLLDTCHRNFDDLGGAGELQLKEDLAEAMLESPGVRESGGRCVIVTMKQHSSGIAKVVNPLGTVLTVHSDDDDNVEVFEDAVIHENCDEALFRPVVASKAVVLADPKKTNALPAHKTAILETKKPSVKPITGAVDRGKVDCNVISHFLNTQNKRQVEQTRVAALKSSVVPAKLPIKTDTKCENKEVKVEANALQKSCEPKTRISPPKATSRKSLAGIVKPATRANIVDCDLPDNKTLEKPKPNTNNKTKINNFSDTITDFAEKSVMSGMDAYKKYFNMSPPPPLDNTLVDPRITLPQPESSIYHLLGVKFKDPKQEESGSNLKDITSNYVDTLSSNYKEQESKVISSCRQDFKEKLVTRRRSEEKELTPKTKEKESFSIDKTLFDDFPDLAEFTAILPPTTLDKSLPGTLNKSIPVVPVVQEKFPSTIQDKYQGLDCNEIVASSPEDKNLDDKSLKKRRKPKPKLGIRITKDAPDIQDLKIQEVTLPPPKKSWSAIAAQNTETASKDLMDSDSDEVVNDKIDTVTKWVKNGEKEVNLIKIEDDKQENSSSQTETTESDDSSKVPAGPVAMDTEEDTCQGDNAKSETNIALKVSKKKPKKKRR